MKVICFLLTFGFVARQVKSDQISFSYQEKTFDCLLDHFNFVDNKTFPLRYLKNDTYIDNDKSPILFYTGNEGDIELFAENTGFMWRLAPELGAMLIFAEHRYYGKSMPFGNDSYKDPQHLGYLTSQQALADFADLLQFLNPDSKRPVIAFGGSYGGMLSAWFRLKYPNLVLGALASSAPVRQFTGLVPCDVFNRILTSVYKVSLDKRPDGKSSGLCAKNIAKIWPILK